MSGSDVCSAGIPPCIPSCTAGPAQCVRRVRPSRKCFLLMPTNLNTLSSQCRLCVGLFSMMTLGTYTLILLRKMIASLHNCIHENFDSFH